MEAEVQADVCKGIRSQPESFLMDGMKKWIERDRLNNCVAISNDYVEKSRLSTYKPNQGPIGQLSGHCNIVQGDYQLRSGGRRCWYWARTCDKASHGPIPIPLGYRGHVYLMGRDELEEYRLVRTKSREKYTAGQLLRTDNTIIHSNHKMKGSKMWKIRIRAGY
ncbi:hypothetical protein TNCV_1373541 [Trichonephila clavipes]|uniref:Uncharacterized protein n=1 Tax=Trichonephila clavipes TaxID=2585209 RepID=A0A8X6WGQ1_TRICX|nr:hypothetical protein TNCV_1373541 [Trichonephila clavipes]